MLRGFVHGPYACGMVLPFKFDCNFTKNAAKIANPLIGCCQMHNSLCLVLKEASRLYVASWVRDIGPELGPNDYKMKEEVEETFNGEKGAPKEREPSTLKDLAVAAREGMETLKPTLQRDYMTRASAYRDALTSFIECCHEGIQEVMETKEEGKFQQGEGTPKNTNLM